MSSPRASTFGVWRITAIVTGAVLIYFLWSTWFAVQLKRPASSSALAPWIERSVRAFISGCRMALKACGVYRRLGCTEARKLLPQYGIELVDMRIKRLDYVESVREKVYTRMISERKWIAAQFRSEGEGRSAEIRGTMEKELRQIRSSAYRQVQELR